MDVFTRYAESYASSRIEELTLQDYLLRCREDPLVRATAAERMMRAIGEPELVDTSHDQRLGRIFLNRTVKIYRAFESLYGNEEVVERIVGFFRHARSSSMPAASTCRHRFHRSAPADRDPSQVPRVR